MNQSVIIKNETLEKIVAHAERTIGRELDCAEKALMEFAIEQVRLGLVK